MFFLDFKT